MRKRLTSFILFWSMLLAPAGALSVGGSAVTFGTLDHLPASVETLLAPLEQWSPVPALSESPVPDPPADPVEAPTDPIVTETEEGDDGPSAPDASDGEEEEDLLDVSPGSEQGEGEQGQEQEDASLDPLLKDDSEEPESSAETDEAVSALDVSLTSVGDPVLYWNAIALQAVADDHTGTFGPSQQNGPTRTSRALAIVHAAVYDAVNSIDQSHNPYLTLFQMPAIMHASIDAAVAEAAYKTLVTLYPAQKRVFDEALRTHMAEIPNGGKKRLGVTIGRFVALQILNARRRDGSEKEVAYTPSNQPGRHRPDPLNPNQGSLGPEWGSVKPFVLLSGSQFRSPPPPALDSQEYADAYEEAKSYGGDGITTPHHRDANQTEMGIFWGYDGTKKLGVPPRLYNQITRLIAQQMGNTVVENARLFALINLAQADAGIGSWESKYLYDYWRPVVAIREADEGTGPTGLGDGNPLTEGDPTFTPLGAPASNQSNGGVNFTPPFPAYPSGHATFGGATFRILEDFYGTDDIPFTFLSDEMNGVTTDNLGNVRPALPRSFARFSDAMEENGQSRIYLGIHWKFDKTAGIEMGKKIAGYVFTHTLLPAGD